MSGDERKLTDALEQTLGLYEHLGEEARINLEPGYNQDEVFDSQFERRAHEIQRTPSAADAIPVIPAKRGPWTGNNQLGIQRKFAPDINNQQTILKLDEWGFPEVWTLALGVNDYSIADDPDPIAFSVTARIEFGSGGAIQVVEIDWLQGAAIALPMNAVNVVAVYAAGSGEGGTSIPDDLRLTATIARGQLTLCDPIRSIAPGEADTFIEIPKFAKSVFMASGLSLPGINPFATYTSGGYVQFVATPAQSGPVCPAYSMSQFVSFIDFTNEFVGGPQWIPIPPFARYLRFLDAAGNPATLETNVFHFRIGV